MSISLSIFIKQISINHSALCAAFSSLGVSRVLRSFDTVDLLFGACPNQVELYVPRKCSATNRIIKADDHASVQINVANVDENGRAIAGSNTTYTLCGFVRGRGEADDCINRLAQEDGLLKNVWSYSR